MFGGGNPASSLSIRKKTTNEEVEQLDEVKVGDKVSFDHPFAPVPGKTTNKVGTVHKIEGDTVHVKTKSKYGVMHYQKKSSELTKIDEAVSKAKDLKTLLARHSELAIAANKDGDHQAVKYHRTKMDNIRNQMAKPAKEEVEPIDEISKDLAKSYLDKTVDPVYGMPKHGMKDRMKGIRQASIRVLKKADKSKIKTN